MSDERSIDWEAEFQSWNNGDRDEERVVSEVKYVASDYYNNPEEYRYDLEDDEFFAKGSHPLGWRAEWHAFYLALHSNDASITTVSADADNYNDHRRPLGKALRFNTHVVTLHFSVENVLPINEYYDMENCDYLRDFIRESPALRTISVTEGIDDGERFENRFLEAIADNPRLECVQLYNFDNLSLASLLRLVETTMALKRLYLSCCSFARDDASLRMLPEAIATNRTIESLLLPDSYLRNGFAVNLFDHLGRQDQPNLPLKELELDRLTQESRNELDLALHTFLRNPAYSLETLRFQYTFDVSSMQLFLEALDENSTLSVLSLLSTTMDDETANMFIEYMQTRTTLHALTVTTGHSTSGIAGAVAATMLRQSPLFVLQIESREGTEDDNNVGGEFYTMVASHAASIRLHRLLVDRVELCQVQAFLQCLPDLVYMRELDVSSVYFWDNSGPDTNPARFTSRQVVQALRRNGSFYSVSIGLSTASRNRSELCLNVSERRLVASFAIRNRMVPLLLSNPIGEGRDGARAGRRRRRRRHRPNSRVSTTWRQFPELMLSAQQTPRIAPNSVLTGLLGLDQSITGVCRHRHPCTRWEQQIYQLRGRIGNIPSDFLAVMRLDALRPNIVSNCVIRALQGMSDPVFVGPLELVEVPSREG